MNANEVALADALRKRGYTVIGRGWPDLLVWSERRENGRWPNPGPRSEHVFAVECKVGGDRLSVDQKIVHRVLQAAGIPVYVGNATDVPPTKGRKLVMRPREYGELADQVEVLRQELALKLAMLDRLAGEVETASLVFDPSEQPVSLGHLWEGADLS